MPDTAGQVRLPEVSAQLLTKGLEKLLDDMGVSRSTHVPGSATRCSIAKPCGTATTASSALRGGTSGSCSPAKTQSLSHQQPRSSHTPTRPAQR